MVGYLVIEPVVDTTEATREDATVTKTKRSVGYKVGRFNLPSCATIDSQEGVPFGKNRLLGLRRRRPMK